MSAANAQTPFADAIHAWTRATSRVLVEVFRLRSSSASEEVLRAELNRPTMAALVDLSRDLAAPGGKPEDVDRVLADYVLALKSLARFLEQMAMVLVALQAGPDDEELELPDDEGLGP